MLTALIINAALIKVYGLKLTPVQPHKERLDLSSEARYLSAVYAGAKDQFNVSTVISPTQAAHVLESDAVKRLIAAVNRWSEIEAKTKGTTTMLGDQGKLFESIVNGAASGRSMLGQLYALSNEPALAIHELELSCPTLWEHQISLKSLDSDGWLDCYSSLSENYWKMDRGEHAIRLNLELVSRMPWLGELLPATTDPTPLSALTHHERRELIRETKRAWALADSVRTKLNEMVSEFLVFEIPKKQNAVITRAKNFVDESVSQFSAESIFTSNPVLEGAIKAARISLTEEIRAEAGHYIALMDKALTESSDSAPDPAMKTVPQGFQSAEEVRQVFSYFRQQVSKALPHSRRASKSAKRQRQTTSKESPASSVKLVSTGSLPQYIAFFALTIASACVGAYKIGSSKKNFDSSSTLGRLQFFIVSLFALIGFSDKSSREVVDVHPLLLEEEETRKEPKHKEKKKRSPKIITCTTAPEKDTKVESSKKLKSETMASEIDAECTEPETTQCIELEPAVSCVAEETTDVPIEEEQADAAIVIDSAINIQVESVIHHDDFDLECYDYDFLESLDRQDEGEWICTSSKPSRLKRSQSAPHENKNLKYGRKRGELLPPKKSRSFRGDKVKNETTSTARIVKSVGSSSENKSIVLLEQAVQVAPRVVDRPRTPSPTTVEQQAISPAKGPFDHIRVKWGGPSKTLIIPKAAETEGTMADTDEDNSEWSMSQPSPNESTSDMDRMSYGEHTHLFPIMHLQMPVPAYFAPAPEHMAIPLVPIMQGPIPIMQPSFDIFTHHFYAVRHQIEYYFSVENLSRDMYLRSLMDTEGFVRLGEICKFNRIRMIGAAPIMILEAVASSNVVTLVESNAVQIAKGNPAEIAKLNDEEILASKIRCSVNPEIWPKRMSRNSME